ncbi:S1 RNA-binding domain-containing protein [Thalassotalea crassostreae]|uniref:CvfB family protein n=1 Tax=Thalassotalea crassostreae TaxID=1763536 RepID=UPI0008388D83|nr:S1-like domain-containing RNA-binding protein [Thalassotalea crassostreae]
MAEIGKINNLNIVKLTEFGAYLDGGDLGEILLPNRYLPEECKEGSDLAVFIYFDSNDRLIATTETPKGQVDDFVSLKCIQVNKMGAFLDWGLSKDLLVPYNQQHHKMIEGKYYLVKIYRDLHTDRIAASSKLDKYLDIWPANYEIGERVELTIGDKTDLGFKAIINEKNWGLLYDNEIFQPLRVGKKMQGYIKNVRGDGRVDLILTRGGIGKVNDFAPVLLQYLQDNDGFCSINDKSSPELISKTFGVSKKAFKSTVGNLLKHGRITIEQDGIRVQDKPVVKAKPKKEKQKTYGNSADRKKPSGDKPLNKHKRPASNKSQGGKPKTFKR